MGHPAWQAAHDLACVSDELLLHVVVDMNALIALLSEVDIGNMDKDGRHTPQYSPQPQLVNEGLLTRAFATDMKAELSIWAPRPRLLNGCGGAISTSDAWAKPRRISPLDVCDRSMAIGSVQDGRRSALRPDVNVRKWRRVDDG
ncbi:hypothetical protein [uncultured Brevundimonas sp.]|uniref:hypothetical protein n=1 Tax=uncultured Brevundimonas sp. TaxID=213418 RepID=UPI0025D220F6|nr:hypothetical protein [uncultured Brevundimonas sp.]